MRGKHLGRLFAREGHLLDGDYLFGGNIAGLFRGANVSVTSANTTAFQATHVVDGAEAAMANLSQIVEDLFRIFFIKILRNFGIFQISRPEK